MTSRATTTADTISQLLRIGLDFAAAATARHEAPAMLTTRLVLALLAVAGAAAALICMNAGAFSLLESRISPGGAWMTIGVVDGLLAGLCFYWAAIRK